MATKKNIIVGAASLFIGPAASDATEVNGGGSQVAPAPSGTTSYRVTVGADINWRDIGYTMDGLEVGTDPSYTDVQVDQLLDAAKIFKDTMSFSVSTTLAEATLENLLIVWGQPTNTLTSNLNSVLLEVDGGSLGDAPEERGIIAVGNSVEKAGATNEYGERAYWLYRVLSVESASHSLSRSEATGFPVTFRALPADDGKYGIVRDRYNVA